MFDLKNKKQNTSKAEAFLSEGDILNMAREILDVIQKRYPTEQAALKELICEGEVTKCTFTINDKPILDINY